MMPYLTETATVIYKARVEDERKIRIGRSQRRQAKRIERAVEMPRLRPATAR